MTKALCAHDWQCRLGDPQRSEKACLKFGSYLVLCQFLDHAEVTVASTVDDDIELPDQEEAANACSNLETVEEEAAIGS